ncbi:MAG TPA: lantibiotic dehydratase [Chitinophaga sp.]|uniref:lantibiotic dehydratase n=1 Tax=Chitinophaga sp. TaxID=1869181 RepID=UPI002DB9689F|nr:lantibiotic dehydratase [Chitinophaga sp.]HEU4555525.1 lantibiotic dehydratase [Chitinophaga sp.]
MKNLYVFDERLVLRTPAYSLSTAVPDLLPLLQDTAFLEAIYLASPVLYNACIKWRDGHLTNKKEIEKITRALNKYYTRMSSRCTPFGLFSGCAVVHWSKQQTAVQIQGRQRHTRLDMHYLCALAAELAQLPGIRSRLLYFPNSSAYTIGDELRYVEYQYLEGKRIHRISAVTDSGYVQRLINAAYNGATIQQLARWLQDDDIAGADAHAFIEELIAAQVLVSEIEPAITGPEFLQQLITVLEKLSDDVTVKHILDMLHKVNAGLQQLDACNNNNIGQYRAIIQQLDKLGVPYEESKLFQADMVQQVTGAGIHAGIQQQLQEALEVMNRLYTPRSNTYLETFKQRFLARYEEKEMPLLEVLDAETGIGDISGSSSNITPLVDDVVVRTGESTLQYNWGRQEALLQQWLLDAYAGGAYTINVKEEDLEGLTPGWQDLPASFAVMFRLAAADTLYVESVGGSSAANLLGRFAHADAAIHNMVNDITRQEQERDPGVVYAEVIHLPESRTGNVLLHPAFRAYEIPYLAKSSLDREQQIDVQDLYVTVKRNKVMLYSRRLGKQVIPRLSTAHNYFSNALPVYRFLCELQLQDKRPGLTFQWGGLENKYRFLPRVQYRNTILHLATWNLGRQDIPAPGSAAMQAFREKWKLPQLVVLADGDNELLINFEDADMVATFMEAIRRKPAFTLREFVQQQQCITDANGNAYANQLVAVLNRKAPAYPADMQPAGIFSACLQRQFIPGSEWLYYKLYCGARSADKILVNAVKPVTALLEEKGFTDKWFFIRYNDPNFHIRLRFHVTDVAHVGAVMQQVQAHLQPFVSAGYIHSFQLDTYNREAERYGANTIELAETFFYHDSVACLSMLDSTIGDERENIRWLWALRAVDELLNSCCLTTVEKLELLTPLKAAFAAEFNMDKALKLQLDNKYRHCQRAIAQMMDAEKLRQEWRPLITILHERSALLSPVFCQLTGLRQAGKLQVPLSGLLSSFMHMMINRIALAKARKQEMVMYDFLVRYYHSITARNKAMLHAKTVPSL